MRTPLLLSLTLSAAFAGPPVITDLQPRGAQQGRPFTLTVAGRDIPEGARIWSTMPASFTPVVSNTPVMMGPGRSAQFLVEPAGSLAPGVYPIRITSASGISNVLLFSIGVFPELNELESDPYSPPNRNDTIETAEPLQTVPVTVNGTLRGPERDLFRIHAKAGETRVFEIEARRCGSAIDPVLRILDGSGKQLVRSDDTPGAGLDTRLTFKFPNEGYYYVELHDARFSRQGQNFYRLKMGSYAYADGVFPLGGKRGTQTAVTFHGGNLTAPVKSQVDLRNIAPHHDFATVALPDSGTLPFVFAVGDYPELIEPSTPVAVPSVINGRLKTAGAVNRYRIQAQPGDHLLIEVQARELGTSKLEAILTAYDAAGKKIDSAGDKPLPEDVFAVQGTSRTSSDPFLNLTVPKDANEITLAIEDLAGRGGPMYAYRIVVGKRAEDFRLALGSPHLNIPAGGTAFVSVGADRRGYDGPIQVTVADLPPGVRVEGGYIPREYVDANNSRTFSRRGVLILSADPGVELPMRELIVWGEGKTESGEVIRRRARGPAMSIDVAGATAQGVVDRQRSVTAPWMGLDLPSASTAPSAATLLVKQVNFTRMEEGDRFDFEYEWTPASKDVRLPDELSVDPVGARDIRVTAQQKNGNGGSFSINTTKATDVAHYDIIVRGRVMAGGEAQDIYARPLPLIVTERSTNAQAAAAQ